MRMISMAFAYLTAVPLLGGMTAAASQCCAGVQNQMQAGEQRAVQLIEDPPTRRKWMLSRDAEHPAWPARLIEMHGNDTVPCSFAGCLQSRHKPLGAAEPVVHARDSVAVVEDAPAWSGALDAVALADGRVGELVSVRLRFSGKVVRVVVVSSGRAIFAGREKAGSPWE